MVTSTSCSDGDDSAARRGSSSERLTPSVEFRIPLAMPWSRRLSARGARLSRICWGSNCLTALRCHTFWGHAKSKHFAFSLNSRLSNWPMSSRVDVARLRCEIRKRTKSPAFRLVWLIRCWALSRVVGFFLRVSSFVTLAQRDRLADAVIQPQAFLSPVVQDCAM